ncbi:MAG: sulfite exporter TauE/SafE family protein [Bradymonadales bacterium]
MDFFSLEIWQYALLFVGGLIASFFNTIAGGGSMLTLPLMVFLGAPSTVANATNRIFMFVQSGAGTISLYKSEPLLWRDTLVYSVPTLIGALIGAYSASIIPAQAMKHVIGWIFLFAFIMYIGKNFFKPSTSDFNIPRWLRYILLFVLGIYGGFIQAGLGAILFLVLNRICQMPKISAMGAKNFMIAFYTLPVLIVFLLQGQVWWDMGLVLSAGAILGAQLAAHCATRISTRAVMVIVSAIMLISAISLILS